MTQLEIVGAQKLDLRPFRRRITALQAWQWTAIGGSIGCVATMAGIVADRLDLWDAQPSYPAAIILFGVFAGGIAGCLKTYSDSQIARSIDRRSGLDDRLTTVFEQTGVPTADGTRFLSAVAADATPRFGDLEPSRLYPFKFLRAHALFLVTLFLCGALYVALETPLFLSASALRDAADLQKAAQQVQLVARPWLAQTTRPEASPADKQLAGELRAFTRDLDRGRLTKQEALIRANQLADQASRLEQQRSLDLSRSLDKAQSAASKLEVMAQLGAMQKSEPSQLAQQAASLQQKIDALQSQIDKALAGRSNLSQAQLTALNRRLEALKRQLQQIQISQEAAEMLAKLQSTPQYQQAMDLLNKLQQENDDAQSGEGAMSPEQMKAIADQLDQLAKELNTDAKMKAYAQALLNAAKSARAGEMAGLSASLSAAFGLNADSSNVAPPDFGGNGRGSTSPGTWAGDNGKLNVSDKSSLLNLNFQNRYITSQKGSGGPESYSEELSPAKLGAPSGIPYQAMLPKYEKSAESALSKGDIPPEMRTKVRDYFDSLHPN